MQGQLDFEDIQALIFTGYGKLPLARYVFLRVDGREEAQRWLREIAKDITTEAELRQARKKKKEKRPEALHIAFTAEGLKALGFPAEQLRGAFPREFVEGMSRPHRSRILGDTGWSDPRYWDFGGGGGKAPLKDIHLVLMLFTKVKEDGQSMEQFHERHREKYQAHHLREVFIQDAFLRRTADGSGLQEWFGFKDGISEPVIDGVRPPSTRGPCIQPGEFILGYENTYGQKSLSPTVPAAWDAGQLLPEAAPGSSCKDLGFNGSYMVIRKLRQNVEAFEQFLRDHGQNEQERELLAAKLMGRWRSGAPLSLCPEQDDALLAKDDSRNNCFVYAQDPHGLQCPLGSHIRRANPRDALIPDDRETSQAVVARHQLLRRGRLYDDGQEKGKPQRGMFFVAFNANLRRQFEFIQNSWLNSTKFGGHVDSKDPIAGDNPDAELAPNTRPPQPCSVTIPSFPVSQRIEGLTRFVEVEGGGYFFLPGIRALHFLSTLEVPATGEASPPAPWHAEAHAG